MVSADADRGVSVRSRHRQAARSTSSRWFRRGRRFHARRICTRARVSTTKLISRTTAVNANCEIWSDLRKDADPDIPFFAVDPRFDRVARRSVLRRLAALASGCRYGRARLVPDRLITKGSTIIGQGRGGGIQKEGILERMAYGGKSEASPRKSGTRLQR